MLYVLPASSNFQQIYTQRGKTQTRAKSVGKQRYKGIYLC